MKCPECQTKVRYIFGSKKEIGYKCYFCFSCFKASVKLSKRATGYAIGDNKNE